MFAITSATTKTAALTKRIKAVQGGTSAGKTIAILQVLIDRAQRDETPTLTSVVSESFPHLKRGAIKDFLSIMESHKYFDDNRWNKSEYTYTFESGSKLEFFSADQPGKVRGPRRDRLFMNECNNIAFETFEQLEIRTLEDIYLDWNPVTDFWVYDNVIKTRNDVDHLILTYKDNEALQQSIIDSIEQRKDRKGWWLVYGLGQLGEVEGKIYSDWQIIDEIPHEAKLEGYGLDFGYSNDPTSVVAIYKFNGGFILDEVCFQKGLLNKQIADILLNQPSGLVVADSAEPKSIDEIRGYGVSIIGVEKKGGLIKSEPFVKWSIGIVQQQRISVTKRSTNIIKEYRNYLWVVDRDGKSTNEPEHQFSHSMDAIRYRMISLVETHQRNKRPTSTTVPVNRGRGMHGV